MATEKQTNSRTLIAISILLLLATAYFFKEKTDLTSERVELIGELEQMEAQYVTLMETDSLLNVELTTERDRIVQMISEISLLENNVKEFQKYKSRYYKIRAERKELLAKADSLMLANAQLQAENVRVRSDLSSEQAANQMLTSSNQNLSDKVAKGSVLTAADLAANAVANNLFGKERLKTKAKAADRLKVCFTLDKNRIAKQGEKEVYVRVVGPDEMVLTKGIDEANSFAFNGERLLYSAKKSVFYEGEAEALCLYMHEDQALAPGTYAVEIYCEGVLVGATSLTLE